MTQALQELLPLSKLTTSQSLPSTMALPGYPPKRSFARTQFLLRMTLDNFCCKHPVTSFLFITLTFPKRVENPTDAHRHLNSMMNRIRNRYASYLWVLGCHDNGGIHYHLLLPVDFDCHTGTYLGAWESHLASTSCALDIEQRNAMNPALREEDDWWKQTVPRFGFGRVQVAPIYSNPEAIRNYLLKQAPEACRIALGDTRYVRFWSCSRDLKCGTTKFAWNSPGGARARNRLKQWALQQGCPTYEDLPKKLGSQWGWHYRCDLDHERLKQEQLLASLPTSTLGLSPAHL